MEKINISKELSTNAYPGRGIIVGKSKDSKKAVIAYFIMGRSENSRNRIFVEDGDNLKTQAFDESKVTDPSLIIYSPVKTLFDKTIVTNGDQTDTIYDFLIKQQTVEQALRTREFEPDAPNYTPRISSVVKRVNGDMNYCISILKSANGDPASCQRFTYSYFSPLAGTGHFIHTYKCDGDPLPSFEGEPKEIAIGDDDIDTFTNNLWENLNNDNKISLFVRFIDIQDGSYEQKIINKNK